MEFNYCYGCLKPLKPGQTVCPHCGRSADSIRNETGLLQTGTVLNGKYLVGRMLGRGGFGVTYLGLELNLGITVAIKEFFPGTICSRQVNSKLVIVNNTAAGRDSFMKGMAAFEQEARTLAMFNSPSIVHVREFFLENNTAYIVMDYVGGVSFSEEIRRCGGRIPWERVVPLMMELMPELDQVHKRNLIHRDIKPDNLRLTQDEKSGMERLVLLDFGSARSFISSEYSGTYTAILTPGYAPIEQYQEHTHLGPYTDVYALCATMYAAITGQKPLSAPDRLDGDMSLVPFSDYGLDVPERIGNAIFHGMEQKYRDRPQSMMDLYREFSEPEKSVPDIQKPPAGPDPGKTLSAGKPKTVIWVLTALILALAVIFLLIFRPESNEKPAEQTAEPVMTTAVDPVPETSATEVDPDQNGPVQTLPVLSPAQTTTPEPTETSVPAAGPGADDESLPDYPSEPTFTMTSTDIPSAGIDLKDGDIFTFGVYEQDEDPGADPIEWKVLAVENDRALVISVYGLEVSAYKDNYVDLSWENSLIREWLNDDFFNTAFNAAQKELITETLNVNAAETENGSEVSNDTLDKLFLLSVDESSRYFDDSSSRACRASRHAVMNGAYEAVGPNHKGNTRWWLRTQVSEYNAAFVNSAGYIDIEGTNVNISSLAIRPAFWLDLSDILRFDDPEAAFSLIDLTEYSLPSPEPDDAEDFLIVQGDLSVGDCFTFGRYEMDEESGADPIEWQTLAIEDGRALAISRYALEMKVFDPASAGSGSGPVETSWETSALREWMNGEFYNTAFDSSERSRIIEVLNTNPDNPEYGSESGNDTLDRVFLLSIPEAEQYFDSNEARQCRYSDQLGYYGFARWVLRTMGITACHNSIVEQTGEILSYADQIGAGMAVYAVRPALWLDLTDEPVEIYAEPVDEPETVETPESDLRYITFGRYEQDEDPGADPIEWQILTAENGRALVLSRFALDTKPYHTVHEDVTWETCTLRQWLNGDFYNRAFSNTEKSQIQEVTNGNAGNSFYGTDSGNDTTDKVFLLSEEEVNQYLKLKFYSDNNELKCYDAGRRCRGTLFAIKNGAYVSEANGDHVEWWLRSPGDDPDYAETVNGASVPAVVTYGKRVDLLEYAVRPALWVDASVIAE